MARLVFNGPEKLKGLDLPLKKTNSIRVRDQIDLQRATGMTMPQIQKDSETIESFAFAVAVFATVRAAGIPITWDEVLDLADDDVEFVSEPGDDRAADEGTEPDPTSAPTASAPVAVAGPAPRKKSAASPKRTSRGSRTPSGGA